ncbi:GAF domain-containing protein, partial [Leptolyngbya sp. FACHB-36]|uniref:GAF domain-containing protein n=1 Tax=Leptolyngbya sp. FACHB-36 TaxID=2692808 RepID=UPI0016817376
MVQPKEPNASDKQWVSLGRTLQVLREEADAEVLLSTTLRYLQMEFAYSLIWIGLYDHVEHRLIGKGGTTPGGEVPILKQRFLLSPGDLLEQVVIQQRPLAVPDLREELRAGEWRKTAKTFNIQGTVIFPIRHRDRCFGVVLLGSTLWGAAPQTDEKARLSMVLGELAASLSQIEADWRQQQAKQLDQQLLALLTHVRSISGLGARLEAIVQETHQFIQPTRTNLYWYEREHRYFWRRVSHQSRTGGFHETAQSVSGITLQDISAFYQALLTDQVVSIGEAHSSLRADATSRLMQQIRARSLLAAPILFQNELLGFLAVEGTDARIWADEERNFIRVAAQIVALTAPLNELEETIAHLKLDRSLTAEIARVIYDDDDWKATLKFSAEQLCKRLHADRFLVLLYNEEREIFEVCYQSFPKNRRPFALPPDSLHPADWQLLEKSTEAIGIENVDGDLRLLAWRDRWLELGVRSLMVCTTTVGRFPEGLVILGHETPRTWNRTEQELVRIVSQQIGLMLRQWKLQQCIQQQQKVNHALQTGLTQLRQLDQLEHLERAALQHIAQVLNAPMTALIAWSSGRTEGHALTSAIANDAFTLNPDQVIPIPTDPLIQAVLRHDGLEPLTLTTIPAASRQWLTGVGIGQVLAIALRTHPNHEPTGVLLVGDTIERHWTEQHRDALATLASQLAWSRRHLMLTERLSDQRQELAQLTWYKHRCAEEAYRSVSLHLKRLSDLGNPKEPLYSTRQQQILRQAADALAPLSQLVQSDLWQLPLKAQATSLIGLLKRSLERVDGVMKQRQLWFQVHDETNLTISGDVSKIELVLYEVLLNASQRSAIGGRIDLWCRQIDNRWLELSITDSGTI